MGDSIQGEDLVLLQNSITDTFSYQSGSSISFFRMMSVVIPCGSTPTGGSGGGGSSAGTYLGKIFSPAGQGRIQDNCEWVLQLVRYSDNIVLYKIDSVGILQNPNTDSAKFYGTQPGIVNNIRNLPNLYAGTTVYLRISTRRTGITPYGMELQYSRSNISKSTYFEYLESNTFYRYNCSVLERIQLDSIYFNKLISYCDSVFLSNGTLSVNYTRRISLKDSNQTKYFWSRYFTPIDTDDYGRIYYIENIPSSSKVNEVKQNFNGLQFGNDYGLIKITKIIPTPIKDNIDELILYASRDFNNCFFDIYGTNGNKLSTLKSINISKGENKLSFELNLYPGMYFLVARSQNNLMLGYTKIVVSK